jgi:hypothetical protein
MLGEIIEDRDIANKLDFTKLSENEFSEDTPPMGVVDPQDQKIDEEKQVEDRLNSILDKYLKPAADPIAEAEGIEDDMFNTSQPKRLKKTKLIQKEKKIKKLLNLKTFFEYEAELGSDNEQHDDVVKKVDDDDNDYMEDDNEDLKDLIADGEDEEDKEDIKEKYFHEMLEKDKEEIRKVISGPELRLKRSRTDIKPDIDYLPLDSRLKKFRSTDDVLYAFNEDILFKHQRNKDTIEEEEANCSNDELKEMYKSYESNVIKKVVEKSKDSFRQINTRMNENSKILANVINLNEYKEKEAQNGFFQKGTIKVGNQVMAKSKYGCHRNSILHAMSSDKYYMAQIDLIKESSTDLSEKSSDKPSHAYFNSNLNVKSALNSKSTNLSSLFKHSSVNKNLNETRRIELNSSGKKDRSLKRILN